VINHSFAGICVNEVRVNGKPVGETELNAFVAGQFGVPVLFISGDEEYVREVKETLPYIESAVVKRGIDRFAAELLPPARAREIIRQKVAEAVRRAKTFRPLTIPGPVHMEVEFKGTNQALMTTTLPCVELVGPKTIAFTCDDMVTAYKLFWGCVIIGMSATNGVLGHVNA
jgi:D-amino peptidase